MDPNNEVERNRLFKAMDYSYKQLSPFRSLVSGLVQEYAGSSYGKGLTRPKFETLMNLMNQTVEPTRCRWLPIVLDARLIRPSEISGTFRSTTRRH